LALSLRGRNDMNVLILSGDPIFRQKNVDALTEAGFSVAGAASYLEGITRIDNNGFVSVIIDEELPDSDLYRACQHVRQYFDIPIILVGSEADEKIWARVEDLGFDFYLKKPVSPRELVARVKAVLRRVPEGKLIRKAAPGKAVETATATAPSNTIPTDAVPTPPVPVRTPPVELLDKQPIRAELPVASSIDQPKIAESPSTSKLPTPQAATHLPPIHLPASLPRSPASPRPDPQTEESSASWRSLNVIRLVNAMVSGQIFEMRPIIDVSLRDSFAYPETDKILETTGKETAAILDSLADEDILKKEPFEKMLLSPEGSTQLVAVERCPKCESSNLEKGMQLEHLSCGNVGLDRDYKSVLRYVCPRCHKELRLAGTDYRNEGVRYRCMECGDLFQIPVTKYRSPQSGKIYAFEDLKETWIYSYRFNEAKKGRLEFELEPKAKLIELLRRRGYQVTESAQMKGRSGAVHAIDILARKDDGIAEDLVAIGIVTARQGEEEVNVDELLKFDTRAYDLGISSKVAIAIPELSPAARKFAERHNFKIFEPKEFRSFISQAQKLPATRVEPEPRLEATMIASAADPKTELSVFLKSRGYQVTVDAVVKGKSGVDQVFDLKAERDDAVATKTLAAAIERSEDDEVDIDKVSEFDSRAYDADINEKIFIAIPKLSPAAKEFALQEHIRVLESITRSPTPTHQTATSSETFESQPAPEPTAVPPREKFITFLRARGYEVVEGSKLKGKSGAEHTLDIHARRNDGVFTQNIIAAVVLSESGDEVGTEPVSQLDAKAYDTGIQDKIMVAIPRLSKAGQQLAAQQGIKLLNSLDLDGLQS
jgi:CheY-like chemotaxis protein